MDLPDQSPCQGCRLRYYAIGEICINCLSRKPAAESQDKPEPTDTADAKKR
jgi:hypothetical protein